MPASQPFPNQLRAQLSFILVGCEALLLFLGVRNRIEPGVECAGLLAALVATYYLMPEWFQVGLFRTFWQVCVGTLACGLLLSLISS